MAKRAKKSDPPKKRGRPKKVIPLDQLDRAKQLLGQRQYSSRVATELSQEYGISRTVAYELIAKAQQSVYESLRGDGKADDPLTAQYLFLQSVIADDREQTRNRIAASAAVIRLLGLNKLLDLVNVGEVDDFLANVVKRRQERIAAAQAKASPPPAESGAE